MHILHSTIAMQLQQCLTPHSTTTLQLQQYTNDVKQWYKTLKQDLVQIEGATIAG